MKNLVLFFIVLIFSSCSSTKIKWKEGYGDNNKVTTKQINKKIDDLLTQKPDDNWARKFYYKTHFVVLNAKLIETKEDMDLVCKSEEKFSLSSYQDQNPAPVPYKMMQVTFTNNHDFSKKVYITKGQCRELLYFKSNNLPASKQFRKNIKKVVLSYIYNEGTYLESIEFDTSFKGVDYIVE